MRYIYTILLTLLLLSGIVEAAPARSGVITFTQPNGEQFQGRLRGDSAFHWIESDAKVVMYNADDKYYYEIQLSQEGKILLKNRVQAKKETQTAYSSVRVKQSISKEMREKLQELQRKSRTGNGPR